MVVGHRDRRWVRLTSDKLKIPSILAQRSFTQHFTTTILAECDSLMSRNPSVTSFDWLAWLEETLGPKTGFCQGNAWGENWSLVHAGRTADDRHQIELAFLNPRDATLFALRWL